jgi:PAS domain S-box-containing protein
VSTDHAVNVLVIDDSEDDRELYRRVLKAAFGGRLNFLEETNGSSGLNAIEKVKPNCVLLDYSLPGQNGIEVLKRIRNTHPHLPIILLTGQGNEAIAAQSIKDGAQDYITKGEITTETLGRAVRASIENCALRQRVDEQLAALRESADQLGHAQRLAHIGSFVGDAGGDETGWSDEIYRIFGRSRETFIPSVANISRAVHPDDREKVLIARDQIRQGLSADPLEYRIVRPDGTIRHVYHESEVIRDDAGGPRHVRGTIQDVTERERYRRDLERSNADLMDFAHIASHDLKAPLRAIDHLSQWIAEDIMATASPATLDNLVLLRGRVRRLRDLLDGLLSYSRIGREHHDPERVDTMDMVTEIAGLLDPPPGFTIACKGNMPVLSTYGVPLRHVLQNLISNGIRHHDRDVGNILISARNDGHSWEFRVTDDGPGIPPRFQERIFQIFQTLQPRDDLESSGLGLAIVKRIVEGRGGGVRIESGPPERGSCFIFTWTEELASFECSSIE